MVVYDRVTVLQVPDADLTYELVLAEDGEPLWSCTSVGLDPGEDCEDVSVQPNGWNVYLGEESLPLMLKIWDGEELVFSENLVWLEQESRWGGPVCGEDLIWMDAEVDLSSL
jgi:hypothetical protein